jgi:FtsP/CotA-like multicopper oxidase with cupredoxin domain
MSVNMRYKILALSILLSLMAVPPAMALVYYQCPANVLTKNGSINVRNPAGSLDPGCRNPSDPNFFNTCLPLLDPITGQPSGATDNAEVVCRAITCGDGHITMADKNDMYIFGFDDVTGVPESLILTRGMPMTPNGIPLGGSEFSAPTFFAREGQRFYLTLTNVGMRERPDLADPHTVHYHGFPNAAPVFDGEPMASFGTNMGNSLTYFYDNIFPGTYMWHCHVEAAEHMQMGMLGTLYILPAQDTHLFNYGGKPYTKFAYDDCFPYLPGTASPDAMCGSTGYDVMYFLQETAFDPIFHHADQTYNRVSFADMVDTYPMLNGRGYPDTVNPAPILNGNGNPSQPVPAIPMVNGVPATIKSGQKVMIHLSSLSTVDFYTVAVPGIPMRIVGQGAQLLRGPTGLNTSYKSGSVMISGGESADILLETTNVAPGTYFLYTTNLNNLSNNTEDFGGMMTEIVVN